MSDETVADVLEGDARGLGVMPMLELVNGARGPETLDYEDWVLPLKLTGGRVCLRVEPRNPYRAYFLTIGPGERLKQVHDRENKEPVVVEPGVLKADLEYGAAVTPVLREETPFAEGEDG